MAYNKSDLVSKIAQKSNLTKAQAEAAVNAFQDVFVEAMKSGEGLQLTGLFSAAGLYIGHACGSRWQEPAQIAGGVVLILLGVKVLLEHLGVIAF